MGFTLIEVLVVIAIMVVLLGLILPAVQRIRESAWRSACAHNLRQLSLAIHLYHSAEGRLPPGQVGPYKPRPGETAYGWGPDSTGWSWAARLLPYLEQENLFVRGGVGRKILRDSGIASERVAVFLCPSDSSFMAPPRRDAGNLRGFPVGHSNYRAVSGANWGYDSGEGRPVATYWRNIGTNGSFDGLAEGDGCMFRSDISRPLRLSDITDGTSNTLLLGEDVPAKNRWCSWPYANNAYGTCAIPPNAKGPDGMDFDPFDWANTWLFRSSHSGGLQFAFADGSVRFIRDTISLSTYRSLATIQGGETSHSVNP